MKIGFDWGGVLDVYGEQFAKVASAMRAQGHEIYIVSAVRIGDGQIVKERIQSSWSGLVDKVITLECAGHETQPPAKLATIKAEGIEWFFDDRADTCELLQQNGVLAFVVPRIAQ
jgi:hypothetical protein